MRNGKNFTGTMQLLPFVSICRFAAITAFTSYICCLNGTVNKWLSLAANLPIKLYYFLSHHIATTHRLVNILHHTNDISRLLMLKLYYRNTVHWINLTFII